MWRLRTFPPAPIRPTRISSSAMQNLLHALLPTTLSHTQRYAVCEVTHPRMGRVTSVPWGEGHKKGERRVSTKYLYHYLIETRKGTVRNDKEIVAQVHMRVRETKNNWTTAEGTAEFQIGIHPKRIIDKRSIAAVSSGLP